MPLKNNTFFHKTLKRSASILAAGSFLMPAVAANAADENVFASPSAAVEQAQTKSDNQAQGTLMDCFLKAAQNKAKTVEYKGQTYDIKKLAISYSDILEKRPDLVIGMKKAQKLGIAPKTSIDLNVIHVNKLKAFDQTTQRAVEDFILAQMQAQKDKKSEFEYDGNTYKAEIGAKKFESFLTARQNFKPSFKYEGETFSTDSTFAIEKQMSLYGNINAELSGKQDTLTKMAVRQVAREKAVSEISDKRYKKISHMQHEVKQGVKKGIISEDQADKMYQKIEAQTKWSKADSADLNQAFAERLGRTYQLMEVCGNPGVYHRGVFPNIMEFAAGRSDTSYFSPNVFSAGGDIYLSQVDPKRFVSELSHAFRQKNNAIGEATQFVRDGLKDLFSFNSFGFTPNAQAKNYDEKGKMEYDAHNVVQPILEDFLDGKIDSIPKVYAKIDARRKKIGEPYAQTSDSEKMIQLGYQQLAEEAEKELAKETEKELAKDAENAPLPATQPKSQSSALLACAAMNKSLQK